MSAQIVKLPNAKRGTVRCPATGVTFPQLYRLTGLNFKFKDGKGPTEEGFFRKEDIEPDLECPADPSYTLDTEKVYAKLANPRWQPIEHLERGVDTGIVIVRHHKNWDSLQAYIDALCDTEAYDVPDRWLSFETDFGYFSVLHRKANEGGLDCALVYTTKVDDPRFGPMDWDKVIDADGQERDFDDLLPPEIAEDMAPIKKKLEELDI